MAPSNKMFTCNKCGKKFGRYDYPAHYRWCKEGKKDPKLPCSVCGKLLKTPQALGKHALSHRPKPKKGVKGAAIHKTPSLIRALARKRDKLREKGMGYLAVAQKLDLTISALRKVD